MAKYKEFNNENNTPAWVGAGRYHPDWELKDWKRELERSPDLWLMSHHISDESIKQGGLRETIGLNHLSDKHWFMGCEKGTQFIRFQNVSGLKDVFWLLDLRVSEVMNEHDVIIYINHIREVRDTTDGFKFGDTVLSPAESGVIWLFGKEHRSLMDAEDIHYDYEFLPKKHAAYIFTCVQNWAYRSVH